MKRMTMQQQIDRLGVLKAEIAERESEYQQIVSKFKEGEATEVEGKLFKLVVCEYERTTIDYKGLVEKLKVSTRMIKKFTNFTTVKMARVLPR